MWPKSADHLKTATPIPEKYQQWWGTILSIVSSKWFRHLKCSQSSKSRQGQSPIQCDLFLPWDKEDEILVGVTNLAYNGVSVSEIYSSLLCAQCAMANGEHSDAMMDPDCDGGNLVSSGLTCCLIPLSLIGELALDVGIYINVLLATAICFHSLQSHRRVSLIF